MTSADKEFNNLTKFSRIFLQIRQGLTEMKKFVLLVMSLPSFCQVILGAGSPVTEHIKRTWLNSGTVLSRSLAVKFGASSTLYFMMGASISCEDSEAYRGVVSGRGKAKSDTLMLAPVIMYSHKNYKTFNPIKQSNVIINT